MRARAQMEVIKILEERDNCIYATVSLGFVQILINPYNAADLNSIAKSLGGDYLVSVSTQYKGIITHLDKGFRPETELYKQPV